MMKFAAVGYSASAAVACAGMVVRRRPRTKAAMIMAGLAGAGLVALLVRRDPSRLPATFDPVDTLKPLAERISVVDSGPLHGFLPVRMTVIVLPDGSVLLHSPTRFTPALKAELDRLGPVRALVAPNTVHWMFVKDWQRAYPDAETWGAPGLHDRAQLQNAGVVIDHPLSGMAPASWGGDIDVVSVPGGFGFIEVALFHRPSRTLVLTDLVLNLEAERLPRWLRPFARLLGITAPNGRAPIYGRAVFRLGGWAARHAGERLVALHPAQVVFSHGRLFEGDQAAALARSLSWLLPEKKTV